MTAKAIKVEQLRQILKLKQDGFSIKAIVRHTGIARNTVKKYLLRLEQAPVSMSAKELSEMVYEGDVSPHKQQRYQSLIKHFETAEKELLKPV